MRDQETGSWWQQISGESVRGPLKGKKLEPMFWDEVRFGLWREDHPTTTVLLGDETAMRVPEDWARMMVEDVDQFPALPEGDYDERLKPREIIIGIQADGRSKAYPLVTLAEQSPVLDQLGQVPIVLMAATDGNSVRCFDRRIDGQVLELFQQPGDGEPTYLDAQTGSTWSFSGEAIEGPMAGRRLERIQILKEFWFDWHAYHPETLIYTAGMGSAGV